MGVAYNQEESLGVFERNNEQGSFGEHCWTFTVYTINAEKNSGFPT